MTDRTATSPNARALTLAADLESIRQITPWLQAVLTTHLPADGAAAAAGPIELALVELATNSVVHAKANAVTLHATTSERDLTVEITDDGDPFDKSAVVAPVEGEAQVHGYGLMIVEQLTAELGYERRADQNHWRAVFVIDAL